MVLFSAIINIFAAFVFGYYALNELDMQFFAAAVIFLLTGLLTMRQVVKTNKRRKK